MIGFLLAATLVLSNSVPKSYQFVVTPVSPPSKKTVKIRLFDGDEYDTKWKSTKATTHRVEARDDKGKRVACALVSNAKQVDLVVTPDKRLHFVCMGEPCTLRTCPK